MFQKSRSILMSAAVATVAIGALAAAANATPILQNGDFSGNASSYTIWPGYDGATGNPGAPLLWGNNNGFSGVNGPDTGFFASSGEPFAPTTNPNFDFAFLQVNSTQNLGTALYAYFNVTPGQSYTVTYQDATRSGDTGSLSTYVENGPIGAPVLYTNNTTPSSSAFQNESFTYTAGSSTQDAIVFQNAGDGSADSTVDFSNVVITATPEPAALGMLGVGGAALLLMRRKRA